MIHAKTMVADGLFSMIGSSNLDARSSEINEEIDVVIYDEKFGREMEASFERDLAQSKPYTLSKAISSAPGLGTRHQSGWRFPSVRSCSKVVHAHHRSVSESIDIAALRHDYKAQGLRRADRA